MNIQFATIHQIFYHIHLLNHLNQHTFQEPLLRRTTTFTAKHMSSFTSIYSSPVILKTEGQIQIIFTSIHSSFHSQPPNSMFSPVDIYHLNLHGSSKIIQNHLYIGSIIHEHPRTLGFHELQAS